MRAVDMTGASINGVLVVERAGSSANGKAAWICICRCGARFIAEGSAIRLGKTKGCQPCGKLNVKMAVTKHGYHRTREHNSYNAMRSRCLNPKDKRFDRYGGRGISICERWLESFSNFIEDMGPQPSQAHSLERIDRDKGYEPSNCVWATNAEQANNRSNNTMIDIDGKTQTMTQWSRETGVNRTVILRRMKRGITGALLIQKGVVK